MEFNAQLILIVLSIILVIFLLALALFPGKKKSSWKKEVAEKVTHIKNQAAGKKDYIIYRHLLIDCDKLLDHSFKQMHLKGQTMGERLKNAKYLYDQKQYNQIWEAHKVRNKLVHEVDYKIEQKEIEKYMYNLLRAISKLL